VQAIQAIEPRTDCLSAFHLQNNRKCAGFSCCLQFRNACGKADLSGRAFHKAFQRSQLSANLLTCKPRVQRVREPHFIPVCGPCQITFRRLFCFGEQSKQPADQTSLASPGQIEMSVIRADKGSPYRRAGTPQDAERCRSGRRISRLCRHDAWSRPPTRSSIEPSSPPLAARPSPILKN